MVLPTRRRSWLLLQGIVFLAVIVALALGIQEIGCSAGMGYFQRLLYNGFDYFALAREICERVKLLELSKNAVLE